MPISEYFKFEGTDSVNPTFSSLLVFTITLASLLVSKKYHYERGCLQDMFIWEVSIRPQTKDCHSEPFDKLRVGSAKNLQGTY